MPRYFLTSIRVEGFRGINNETDPLELKFRADAVNSVFAVNGIGKSSLYDALSYAIRGKIAKLEALQTQERAADYYCNRFHSRGHAVIHLEFAPDDGGGAVTIRVERSRAGVRSVSSPSGHSNPNAFLASLDADFTLLDYKTFSRFIDDSPLERGRSFSALLGLSAYSDMRQSLQAASDTRSLNSDFDINVLNTSITTAQQAAQQALISIRTNYERVTGNPLADVDKLDQYMQDVTSALGNVPLLASHFQGKALADVEFDAVKKAIREAEGGEKRKELERVIESIGKLETLGTVDATSVQNEQVALSNLIDERDALLASTRGDLFKRLYEDADALIAKGEWSEDSTCPLCFSPLTTPIKAHIDSQLSQYHGVADKIARIKEAWRSAQWIRRLALLEKTEGLTIEERSASARG